MTNTRLTRWTGLLLILEVLVFSSTVVVGRASGFAPGTTQQLEQFLPQVAANHAGLIIVYLAYIFSGVLLIPIALLLPRVLADRETPLLRIGAAFGVTSAILRVISVSRYLFLVPFLADTYMSGKDVPHASIIFAYQANDAFAGTGLGEYLGDGLFLCLWLGILAFVMIRTRPSARWLGWIAGAIAFGAATEVIVPFISEVGFLPPVILTTIHLWFIALAIVLLRIRATAMQQKSLSTDQFVADYTHP